MCIQGGYKTQTITQIANLVSAYDAGEITLAAVRIYIAALVSVAAREAAKRSRSRERRAGEVIPQFFIKELSRASELPLARARREVLVLKRLGLLTFGGSEVVFSISPRERSFELRDYLAGSRSPLRPIPLPRPLLRFLARCSKASTIKTTLAYCARGLTLSRQGEITGKGSVKATWISDVMNLSERSVRSARSDLLRLGWITDDENSFQRKLNRDGAYFTINFSWKDLRISKEHNIQKEGSEGGIKSPVANRLPVDNSFAPSPTFAPPQAQNMPNFAPPYKNKKTSSYEESKNQKTQPERLNSPGVCKTKKAGESKPRIYDVKPEDLGSFSRVEELFFQAVKRELIEPTEAGAVNFLAAAVRAKTVSGDAPRVFMGIVRGKLWKNITQADEDRALAALRRFRADNPDRFRCYASELKEAA